MFDDLLDVVLGVPPEEHLGAPHHLRGHHVHVEVQLCQHGGAGVLCGPKIGIRLFPFILTRLIPEPSYTSYFCDLPFPLPQLLAHDYALPFLFSFASFDIF